MKLSEREQDVIDCLLTDCNTIEQIADKLILSKTTVRTHLAHIREKLNVHSIPEIIRYQFNQKLEIKENQYCVIQYSCKLLKSAVNHNNMIVKQNKSLQKELMWYKNAFERRKNANN